MPVLGWIFSNKMYPAFVSSLHAHVKTINAKTYISIRIHTLKCFNTWDGSVGLVSQYGEHFTEILWQDFTTATLPVITLS